MVAGEYPAACCGDFYYKFVENQDFIVCSVISANQAGRGGHNAKDYHLTLNAALVLVAKENHPARDQIIEHFIRSSSELSALWQAIMEMEIPEEVPDTMFVYAIRNRLTGNIKIGISRNPGIRLKQMQVTNDGVLELIATRKADNRYRDERLAHATNWDKHLVSEWFGPSAKLN
ncbi:antA/AntB antirepressor family protein [Acidithiobacillus sp. MC6.1]|nr:antA/AntB antirepressor family protein [Acidithiobacillus sp. MC6.1]